MHAVAQVLKDYSLVLLTSDEDQPVITLDGGGTHGDLEEGFEHSASDEPSTLMQVGQRPLGLGDK